MTHAAHGIPIEAAKAAKADQGMHLKLALGTMYGMKHRPGSVWLFWNRH
jgi:hypothetical protein